MGDNPIQVLGDFIIIQEAPASPPSLHPVRDRISVEKGDITQQSVGTIVNAPMQNPCREGTAIWIVCQAAIERRTLAEVRAELDRHASGTGARLLEYKGDLRNEKKLDIRIEGDRLVWYGPLGRQGQ